MSHDDRTPVRSSCIPARECAVVLASPELVHFETCLPDLPVGVLHVLDRGGLDPARTKGVVLRRSALIDE